MKDDDDDESYENRKQQGRVRAYFNDAINKISGAYNEKGEFDVEVLQEAKK